MTDAPIADQPEVAAPRRHWYRLAPATTGLIILVVVLAIWSQLCLSAGAVADGRSSVSA
jgi:hypothetical protein